MLADSMSRLGLLQQITVMYQPEVPRPIGLKNGYLLVAGAHRLAAAKKLRWGLIEASR
jgi:ParB-like chromosome segregation protein Spo0J